MPELITTKFPEATYHGNCVRTMGVKLSSMSVFTDGPTKLMRDAMLMASCAPHVLPELLAVLHDNTALALLAHVSATAAGPPHVLAMGV